MPEPAYKVSPDSLAAEPLPEPRVREPDPVRRAYRTLLVLAFVALALAVLVNWLWAADASEIAARPGTAAGQASDAPEPIELAKPSVDLIPERVIQFETISHQPVPGLGDQAGEAVYKTLNMNIEAQIETVVYARVEGFGSPYDAKTRLDAFMAPYSANRSAFAVNGVTPAMVGEAPDGSTYVVGWVRGDYLTLVKASFAEWTPATNRVDIIKRQGDQIVDAVDVYQRTGREGVSK